MKVSIIGAGAMGGALAEGLLKRNKEQFKLSVSNPSQGALDALAAQGAMIGHDNRMCIKGADVIVLAVKPWILPEVIAEISSEIDYKRQIVVVVAASVSGDDLKAWFNRGDDELPRIVICMPNTAMSVGKSMTFLVPVNIAGDSSAISDVASMFNLLGETMTIDERHLPAATALASCGIAYAMRYVRAAVEGGVELGFKADIAQKMVTQTLIGACALLERPGVHPESEIDKVTTPGGLTIKGLNEMEHAGFTSAVIRGLKACVK